MTEPKVVRYEQIEVLNVDRDCLGCDMRPMDDTDPGPGWYSQADYEALAARVEEFWCTIANQKAEIIRLLDVLEDIRDHRTKYPGDAEQEMIDMAGVAILGGDPTP